ncbi:MAG: SusC/RagA family TonB-linked outer membrane protein [Longimonas sp.]|uniref:SusC/RagA family TonB-linked outer membrane protein n=1 Tax=Longimonas sp. TaxID=2039626 RepID=UPI0033633B3C
MPLTGWAQTTVEGTVTDAEDGSPLPGVNVTVQNTQIGTLTDPDGTFTINVPADRNTLVFSFVGFQRTTVTLEEGQTSVEVSLEPDVVGLDEVVVTGLASSIARENLANSVETISSDDLAGRTNSQTLDGALSGKVAGAEISSYSGAPGGGMSVKLRGVSTINGNSQPLYIIDGVVVNNSAIPSNVNAVTQAAAGGSRSNQDNPVNRIADLNPQDIESIEILKGPSAAAIYGGRAANGVVIINTKSGASDATRVDFSQTLGATTIRKKLGTRQFTAETAEAAFGSEGRTLFLEAQNEGRFIDYEDELFGNTGLLSTTSLSISGGNEDTRFFLSGLLQNDDGIVERTGYDKRSVRLNLDHDLSDRIQLSGTVNYVNANTRRGLTGNDNSGTTFGVALTATPNFIDIRPDEDGNYPDHPFNASNPLQTRDLFTNQEVVNRTITSAQVEYTAFNTEQQSLRIIGQAGADFFSLESEALFPETLQFERTSPEPGTSILGETTSINTNVRLLGVHSYTLSDSDVTFTTQAGVTGVRIDQMTSNFVARGLIPGQQNLDQATSLSPSQVREVQNDRSFFAQEEVNIANQVIATVGVRGDRSTLNGDVDRFYLYPKASAALNIHNFAFWSADAVNQFKLRAAFGQTGNIAGFGTKFTSFEAVSVGGVAGTLINPQRGSADVEPERQTEIEAGIDLGLWDNRANLALTVYRKEITDQLLQREVPASTGFRLETFNGGTLLNRGVEATLALVPVERDRFSWNSRTSFWANDAEVTSLPVPAFRALGGGFGATLGEIRIEEGQSPTQIVGIDDRNGDGTSDGVFQLGDVAPDFQMSFTNDFTFYENLTLSVLAHWKKGGDNLNLSELLFDLSQTSPDFDEDSNNSGVPDGAERVGNVGVSAAQFVQDASYFRIREIGLFYDLPTGLLDRTFNGSLRSVRIGASARNWFTITPYKSYDPEVNNFGTQPVSNGVEVTPFPQSKELFFHLRVGL